MVTYEELQARMNRQVNSDLMQKFVGHVNKLEVILHDFQLHLDDATDILEKALALDEEGETE